VAQKVHVGIVLDRSGSMEDCRTDAIGAVNSYLRQVKDDKDIEASISLITFDSQSIDVIRDKTPAGSCAELAASEYQPRASTPLLDAVGHGVALLDKRKEPGERCILAVMTDGLENASREYTKETIKALLDRKQKEEGWLVLYLGADHDAGHRRARWGCTPATLLPSTSRRLGPAWRQLAHVPSAMPWRLMRPATLPRAASPRGSAWTWGRRESANLRHAARGLVYFGLLML
jgi:hypothetical protein